MSKNKRSDFILVFDRYFSKKPNAFISALIRALYCLAEALCMLFCLLGIYDIPANPFIVIILCTFFTVGLCALFSFVKKRIVIPCMAGLGLIIVYLFRKAIWNKFTFFVDAVFRALDGYVFSMKRYMWHVTLTENNEEEILFTLVGVIFILSLVCAASMFKKPNGVAPLTTFVVLIVPMLAAQKLSFNFWLVPTVALIVGSFAASKAFSSGIITRGGVYSGCKKALKNEERSLGASLKTVPHLKATELRTVHYSKYFSASICAAAIFTAAGILGSAIMKDQQGMDITPAIDYFMQFSVPIYDAEEDDGEFFGSSYFSDRLDNTLGITAPSKNKREVLRVSTEGDGIYVHGDFGIKFDGQKWTSPVYSNHRNLPESYRPFEVRTLDTGGMGNKFKKGFIKEYLVELDYVAQTDVAFAPTYSDYYTGFYDSNKYNVYGDFVLRSKEPQKSSSFVAGDYFLNYTGDDRQQKVDNMAKVLRILKDDYFSFGYVFDLYAMEKGCYEQYLDYVNETYLDVPRNMENDIIAFLTESALYTRDLKRFDQGYQYKKCLDITDYLKNNFTYSLDTNNGYINPVMTFLNKTKSGHCALYATAMTLMVREMGLPARYCTGFILPYTGLGNEATLYSSDLHAWCEVYFDNVGWVLFDPTSSSLAGSSESSEPSDSESSDSESSDTESSDEESDLESSEESEISDSETSDSEISDSEDSADSKDSSDNADPLSSDISGGGNGDVNFLPFVLALLFVAVVAAIVAICVHLFRKLDRQAKETLDRAGSFGDCEKLYAQILEILKLCGYTQRTGEQPESFFARVDRHFRTKLSKHSRTLLKVAFAKGKFSGSDLSETAVLLKDLFTAAEQQLLIYGRIKLCRIIIGNNNHSEKKQK